MTLTVRLDAELERQLESYCRKRRKTKSEVLTALLRDHLAAARGRRKTPYQLAREFGLIGAVTSGKRDLGENHRRYLREIIRAKHHR